MAFLTSQRGSGEPNVAKAFEKADQTAISIKSSAIASRDRAQAGTVTAGDLIDGLLGNLSRGKAILDALASIDGLAEYAAAQYADAPGYDIVAQFQTMRTEINSTIAFLEANYPNDAGSLRRSSFVGDGSGTLVSYANFTAPQRAAIVTRLNALIAAID
jgi:hypothetical protein